MTAISNANGQAGELTGGPRHMYTLGRCYTLFQFVMSFGVTLRTAASGGAGQRNFNDLFYARFIYEFH